VTDAIPIVGDPNLHRQASATGTRLTRALGLSAPGHVVSLDFRPNEPYTGIIELVEVLMNLQSPAK